MFSLCAVFVGFGLGSEPFYTFFSPTVWKLFVGIGESNLRRTSSGAGSGSGTGTSSGCTTSNPSSHLNGSITGALLSELQILGGRLTRGGTDGGSFVRLFVRFRKRRRGGRSRKARIRLENSLFGMLSVVYILSLGPSSGLLDLRGVGFLLALSEALGSLDDPPSKTRRAVG